jgi:hypothetical protein
MRVLLSFCAVLEIGCRMSESVDVVQFQVSVSRIACSFLVYVAHMCHLLAIYLRERWAAHAGVRIIKYEGLNFSADACGCGRLCFCAAGAPAPTTVSSGSTAL